MNYKFLWNFRLWFKGICLVIMFPFVVIWLVLVDAPIEWAKIYESNKESE